MHSDMGRHIAVAGSHLIFALFAESREFNFHSSTRWLSTFSPFSTSREHTQHAERFEDAELTQKYFST